MKGLFNVRNVAHYVVNRCFSQNHPVSNLQLQKILYFLQTAFCRRSNGSLLLFDEEFQAWPYGPVIESVYNEFCRYGGRVIRESFSDELDCSADTLGFINEGIDVLSRKSPWELVRVSHADGSPWSTTYRDGDGYKETIDNDLIRKAACGEAC